MLIYNSPFKLAESGLKQIGLGLILLVTAFGCGPSPLSLADISAKKVGKTAILTGTVVSLAPLVDNTAYQIKDPTGKIWVTTTQNPPQIGQQVEVKGTIEYQSLPVGDRELGEFYIVELEQLPLEETQNGS